MAFNSYEELAAAVEERRQSVLTLEIDMGAKYSEAYEEAKQELAQAKAMQTLIGGGQGFLGDNLGSLEAKVAELKPEPNSVWVQYRKLDLDEWALLVKQANLTAVEQYERVLTKTFIAVYGQDPIEPDEGAEGWEAPKPLSTDAALLSSKSPKGILPGGSLIPVVQAFIAWQNSGGDVSIRPTKSGLV